MLIPGADGRKRCFGNKAGQDFYAEYHDHEWGVPEHDDTRLFEMLVLEGAQAGLSWETVLKKRAGYRRAFHGFEVDAVARMTDQELAELRQEPAIIRNRLKIESARRNARVVLSLQETHGSLDDYLWAFVDGSPIVNCWKTVAEIPVSTPLSNTLSRELKKQGMSFVGTTIIYAYMQAVGMVNDHPEECWRYPGS